MTLSCEYKKGADYILSCDIFLYVVGRDSSVGTATRYRLDGPGIEIRWGEFFRPGAHPASYGMVTGSFAGVKRPEGGVDHPPHLVPRLKEE